MVLENMKSCYKQAVFGSFLATFIVMLKWIFDRFVEGSLFEINCSYGLCINIGVFAIFIAIFFIVVLARCLLIRLIY